MVLAVRADFFGRCADHTALAAALQDATLLVGPMDTHQLRAAIVRPAAARGLIVERDLTARIIEEINGEPGSLPLMSHALMETWRHRQGRTLTTQIYEATGGLHGAIARTAEDTYTQLPPTQATLARRTLLRLITPGDGTQDTRHPINRNELNTNNPADTTAVLEHLTSARLITLDNDTIDLTHEALITAWPRLRQWIEQDRERLRVHRQLTHDTLLWHKLDRDPSALYRGTRLTRAQETFTSPEHNTLNPLETAFLNAALAARETERAHAARAARRSRRAVAALASLCALALVVGTIAWQQKQNSDQQHTQAEARRIATVAASLRTTDPVRAMRLSLAAWQLSHTPETHSALLAAALSQREQDAMPLPDDVDPLNVHLSGDGRTLVYLAKDRIRRFDVRTHQELAPLKASKAKLAGGFLRDITRDGRAALITGAHTRVYSAAGSKTETRDFPSPPGEEFGSNGRTEFGSNGRTLVWAGDVDVQLWDWRHRHLLFRQALPDVRTSDPGEVTSNGRYLAACPYGRPPAVWKIVGNRAVTLPLSPAQKVRCGWDSVEFTPDGRGLLRIDEGHGADVRDLGSGRLRWRVKHSGLTQVRLSKDGKLLAGQDADEILLWRISRPDVPVLRYPIPNEEVSELQIDTEAHVLRYMGGGAVRSISYPPSTAWRATPADAAQFSHDGRKLAISLVERNRTRFQLLNAGSGTLSAELPDVPCRPTNGLMPDACSRWDSALAFRPDGNRLAYLAASTSGEYLHVWDLRTQDRVQVPSALQVTDGHALFSANGKLLLTAELGKDNFRIWDTRRHTIRTLRNISGALIAAHPDGHSLVVLSGDEKGVGRLLDLRTHRIVRQRLTGEGTTAVAFGRDGRLLAAGDEKGRVTLWDGKARQRLGELPATDGATSGSSPQGINALAFSPDGDTLATAGDKGTVRLWDTTSNHPLGDALPTAPGDPVLALAFTPDGKALRVAGEHTPLQTYSTAPQTAVRTLCRRAGSGLTPDEWHSYLPDLPYRTTC
ncbi:hypothetical protein Stube_69720 [Streptomyces tubercidicus]|uniref:Novel STAND NTPase 1 domain-containing protein n=1 Tax=Streptomyces tubercidicus TaxID=47759 RepID=A0A640V291_9ACTN|nr:hypothetical protein Stube_69720 [Streptomyces tubercidicus]